jgi:hypothetical protein
MKNQTTAPSNGHSKHSKNGRTVELQARSGRIRVTGRANLTLTEGYSPKGSVKIPSPVPPLASAVRKGSK